MLRGVSHVRLLFKVLVIAFVLAAVFAATFALWGDWFETVFSQKKCVEWFQSVRSVAWLIAIGLLIADLLLPVPATGVMAALGVVYGMWIAAAVGAAGSMLAGLLGYGLARLAGRSGIRWIADEGEIKRFRAFFDRWGGAGVIVSRVLPILPEVMSILAGLAPMRFGRFLGALLLGTIPVAILFAWLGSAWAGAPWYGVGAAVLLSLVLWPVFLWLVRRGSGLASSDDEA